MELAEHVARAAQPTEAVTAVTLPTQSRITHYGESFNGRPLGCGYGPYSSDNPTIVAVSPAKYAEIPCGTELQLCGPGGCIIAMRQDACPGCSADHFDLSESAFAAVCGQPTGVCSATVNIVQTCTTMDLSWADRPEPPERERTRLDALADAAHLGLGPDQANVELPTLEPTPDAAPSPPVECVAR